MIYKNIEIHNIAELVNNDDGSVSWKRVPEFVLEKMEKPAGKQVVYNSTGVELRFVIKGESVVIRMSATDNDSKSFNPFHIFRGGIQGTWEDHEVHCCVSSEPDNFVIKRSENIERLKEMSMKIGSEWEPEVVRVIFDRGKYKIYDIIGDVVPPTKEQLPKLTMLSYGSSITHGSNSIDASHSWVSVVAHNLNLDSRNLGMAGSCALEPEMAEYISSEGEKGNWDIATLELGINVLDWEEEKIYSRVENMIKQVAGRNPEKHIFVISPFYHCGDDFDENDNAKKWRKIIEDIIRKLDYSNVEYINGLDVLDNMSYISADEVHPNIYGVQRIADIITKRISNVINEQKNSK